MTDLENKQAYFTNLNADNTQVFYTKNYKFWYLQNSKQANFNNETLTGLKKDVRGITNILGFRNDNIEVATVDMDGYKIKEDEFIEYELGKVNELLLNSTITSQLKRKLKYYLEFLNTKIEAPEVKTLTDLITHEKAPEVVQAIKTQYKNIQGKRLKLLLMALQENDLLPSERIASKFHTLCKKEFDWEIASYQAMNDYKFNEITDKQELTGMTNFIKQIIDDK